MIALALTVLCYCCSVAALAFAYSNVMQGKFYGKPSEPEKNDDDDDGEAWKKV